MNIFELEALNSELENHIRDELRGMLGAALYDDTPLVMSRYILLCRLLREAQQLGISLYIYEGIYSD